MKRNKRDIFLSMLTNPIFIIVYAIASYYFIELCQFGGIRKRAPILLICGVFLLGWIIWFVIRILINSKRKIEDEVKVEKTKLKKAWIIIAIILIILISAITGYKIYKSAINYNGKLSWYLHDLFNKKEIEFEHNNIYDDGVEGLFSDISNKIELPKELYISNTFDLKFKKDGTITSISTFVYGKDDDGKTNTFLLDYDYKKSDKITVYLNGYTDATYDEDMSISPLIETVDVIPIEDTIMYWNADEYGILYIGNRDFGYNIEGIKYVNEDGKVREATKAQSIICGYFVSIYVPNEENTIYPIRYKLVSDISLIEGEDYKGQEENIEDDENITNEISKSEVLSNGTVQFYLNDNIGYRLEVVGAALGSREYSFSKTIDKGKTWTLINENPFNRMGGANGIGFIDENIGFIGISISGGSSSELYRTEDGGRSFNKVEFPDVKVSLVNEETYNPFDSPKIPYKDNDYLYMRVGQGADGDYNRGCDALYKSKDMGITWEYLEEIND